MTEFITRCCHAEKKYEVIIKTDSEEHYKATQDFARQLIDHAKPMINEDIIRNMTTDELADFIGVVARGGWTRWVLTSPKEWLQQPVEGE